MHKGTAEGKDAREANKDLEDFSTPRKDKIFGRTMRRTGMRATGQSGGSGKVSKTSGKKGTTKKKSTSKERRPIEAGIRALKPVAQGGSSSA